MIRIRAVAVVTVPERGPDGLGLRNDSPFRAESTRDSVAIIMMMMRLQRREEEQGRRIEVAY